MKIKKRASSPKRLQQMNQGTSVMKKLQEHDKCFEQIEKKLNEHDKRFAQIDKRFEHIEKKLEEHDKRFEQIDKRFAQIDKKLEEHDRKFEFLIEKFMDHENRLIRIEETMVTKTEFYELYNKIDNFLALYTKKDQENTIMAHQLRRTEERIDGHDRDISQIKLAINLT